MSSIAPYFVSQIQHGFPLSTGFNDAPLVNTDMDDMVQCLELLLCVFLCSGMCRCVMSHFHLATRRHIPQNSVAEGSIFRNVRLCLEPPPPLHRHGH